MRAASRPPDRRSHVRLLEVDRCTGEVSESAFAQLPERLRPGDLLVVNDAATLPGSLRARAAGTELEIRLLGPTDDLRWQAVLLGAGSWRDDTTARAAPPLLSVGDTLRVGSGLGATVEDVSVSSPRLVELSFDQEGADLWASLYAAGVPVQYSHLEDDLPLWSVQTVYGARPWAAEMPSAGRPLTWGLLLDLRARNVEVAWLTHAAGLSATGDPSLDRMLPLPERYEIPRATAEAVARARSRRSRVVAVGTTVVRALEGCAAQNEGRVVAESGVTDLVIDESHRLRVVDGILSGMHAPGESHFSVLRAFSDESTLTDAWRLAESRDYRCHEFGDAMLVAGRC